MKPIFSPEFKLGDAQLQIWVVPHFSNSPYIWVGLLNFSEKDVTVSCTLKFLSPILSPITKDKDVIQPERGIDVGRMSHDAYRTWARDHEDVFNLEVKMTLHVKSEELITKR